MLVARALLPPPVAAGCARALRCARVAPHTAPLQLAVAARALSLVRRATRSRVCCSARPPPMRDASGQPNTSQMLVFVPPHPLLKHWLAVARSSGTPPQLFRSALAELGRLLIYEARGVCCGRCTARALAPLDAAFTLALRPAATGSPRLRARWTRQWAALMSSLWTRRSQWCACRSCVRGWCCWSRPPRCSRRTGHFTSVRAAASREFALVLALSSRS